MAAAQLCSIFGCMVLIVAAITAHSTSAQLYPDFYDKICPQALAAIKMAVEQAVAYEPRMGASLLRLHFHDCFVNVWTTDMEMSDLISFHDMGKFLLMCGCDGFALLLHWIQ